LNTYSPDAEAAAAVATITNNSPVISTTIGDNGRHWTSECEASVIKTSRRGQPSPAPLAPPARRKKKQIRNS